MPVLATHAPAHRVRRASSEPGNRSDDHPASRGRARRRGQYASVTRENADGIHGDQHRLAEAQLDLRGGGLDGGLLLGARTHEHDVTVRNSGNHERAGERCENDERTPHPPAIPPNRPKMGAASRSAKRRSARTMNVSAKPVLHTSHLGRNAWPIGNSAATTSIQPMAWWRKAARE